MSEVARDLLPVFPPDFSNEPVPKKYETCFGAKIPLSSENLPSFSWSAKVNRKRSRVMIQRATLVSVALPRQIILKSGHIGRVIPYTSHHQSERDVERSAKKLAGGLPFDLMEPFPNAGAPIGIWPITFSPRIFQTCFSPSSGVLWSKVLIIA